MSSVFVKHGNSFMVQRHEELDIHSELPSGNYIVKFDPQGGNFYLDQTDSFSKATKIYGDSSKTINRIISTFMDRPKQTGVMLFGKKGSGKTLIAREVSIELASQGMPTIIVNSAFSGASFNQFIGNITQPCVVLFDEFEKVYDRDGQEQVLTLLDGTVQTKKLFIITSNSRYRLDNNLLNRPGRMFYSFEYKGLDESFIREYMNDHLTNKDALEDAIKATLIFSSFSFDMLQALVEELNRYNETPSEALKFLNIDPTDGDDLRYNVRVFDEFDNEFSLDYDGSNYHGNPLEEDNRIQFYPQGFANNELNSKFRAYRNDDTKNPLYDENFYPGDASEIRSYKTFYPSDIVSVSSAGITFVNEKGEKAIMTRKTSGSFTYSHLF